MIRGNAAAILGIPGLDRLQRERRKHQRVKVSLMGRYMLSDRREFPCQTLDMSPGGVALIAPVKAPVADKVIVYLDQIGRVEGTVARHLENGFALALAVPLLKREKLADQLTWLANRHALGMPEDRRHERIQPRLTRTTVRLPDGASAPGKVVDLSISGASVSCDIKVAMGMRVTVGETPGKVVRIYQGGFAVEFLRPLNPETFSDTIKL
jgi:hypothetical protein